MLAYTIGALSGFVMVITLVFNLGVVVSILETPTGYPFIQILYNSTKSLAATNGLTAVIIVILSAGTIGGISTASRQVRQSPFSFVVRTVSAAVHQSSQLEASPSAPMPATHHTFHVHRLSELDEPDGVQIWSFARDGGFPFSQFLSHVSLPPSRVRRPTCAKTSNPI